MKNISLLIFITVFSISSYGQVHPDDLLDKINILLKNSEEKKPFDIHKYHKYEKTGVLVLKRFIDELYILDGAQTHYAYVKTDSTLKRVRAKKPSIYKKFDTEYKHWVWLNLSGINYVFTGSKKKKTDVYPFLKCYGTKRTNYKFKTKEEANEFEKLMDELIKIGSHKNIWWSDLSFKWDKLAQTTTKDLDYVNEQLAIYNPNKAKLFIDTENKTLILRSLKEIRVMPFEEIKSIEKPKSAYLGRTVNIKSNYKNGSKKVPKKRIHIYSKQYGKIIKEENYGIRMVYDNGWSYPDNYKEFVKALNRVIRKFN